MANGEAGTLDLRGQFIRAWGPDSSLDSDRALGSHQSQSTWLPADVRVMNYGFPTGAASSGIHNPNSFIVTDDAVSTSGSGVGIAPGVVQPIAYIGLAGTTAETRPSNIALLMCMKK